MELHTHDVGLQGVNWIYLDWNRVQRSSCEHGNEPSGAVKGGEFLD
jgi:hypothetical protein